MSEHAHEIVIHIDKKMFKVDGPTLTGAQLRALPAPPISQDYDLVLEGPGGDDRRISDAEVVELKNGMHFFSAPKNLTPGRE